MPAADKVGVADCCKVLVADEPDGVDPAIALVNDEKTKVLRVTNVVTTEKDDADCMTIFATEVVTDGVAALVIEGMYGVISESAEIKADADSDTANVSTEECGNFGEAALIPENEDAVD